MGSSRRTSELIMVPPLYVKAFEYEEYRPCHFKRYGIELRHLNARYLEHKESERAKERLSAVQPTRDDVLAIVKLLVQDRTKDFLDYSGD